MRMGWVMKKRTRGPVVCCMIIVILLCLGYLGLALYYRTGFAVNTWINGVYCTGRSVQEVNAQLLERTEAPDHFTIVGYDRMGSDSTETSWTVSMESLHRTLDYEAGLNRYLTSQNSWFWVGNLLPHREHRLEAAVSFEETVLQEFWEEIAEGFRKEEDYRIEYDDSVGYTLYDGLHHRLDEKKAYEAVRSAILMGESSVSLIDAGCYYDVPFTGEQERMARLWEQIRHFQENGPLYDFGDGAGRPDEAQMAAFLQKGEQPGGLPVQDEAGCFVLEPDCAADWIREMAAIHDTYGKEWAFQSTRGDIVHVQGVTYGTTINQKRETVWLQGYLEQLAAWENGLDSDLAETQGAKPEGSEEVRIPEYTRDAYHRGSADLGKTYIEVDLGIQKLYYYVDGELALETDVVSGNARRRMSTPEGVNYVYNKQKNRTLRGPGYATPVKFWMPVKGAIGLHDADWRSEFGGDIYKTDGSHGCVNLPPEVAKELYDSVEIGTPVVMFYGEDPEETQTDQKTK